VVAEGKDEELNSGVGQAGGLETCRIEVAFLAKVWMKTEGYATSFKTISNILV